MAQILGAIFDCDGTLLDSMQMWYSAFEELVGRYSLEATKEMQETVEPITLPESCAWLHETYGIGESGPALNEELISWVRHEYATNVAEMPGARAMVEELHEAGVPMIIATSTSSAEVREALAVHGLDQYFIDVVCTAEVRDGRDKDFPDVYLEALERLGTPLEHTWVFEDAPFGVQTSRKAGFHVVGIHNDHDGRDEAAVRPWADIFSENYEGVSLAAIRAYGEGSGCSDGEA